MRIVLSQAPNPRIKRGLNGLPTEYDAFKTTIRNHPFPKTMDEFSCVCCSEALHVEAKTKLTLGSDINVAFTASKGGSSSGFQNQSQASFGSNNMGFPQTIVAEEVIEVIVVVDTLILEEIIEVGLEEDKVIRASQSGTHSLLVQLLVRFAISQITLLLSVGIGWITTSNHWFSNQLQVLPGLMSLLHLLHRTGISIQQPQIT